MQDIVAGLARLAVPFPEAVGAVARARETVGCKVGRVVEAGRAGLGVGVGVGVGGRIDEGVVWRVLGGLDVEGG
jgi:hypothetical protein